MIESQLALILFQYPGGGGVQYGAWPTIGILIGVVAGVVAGAARRSGARWGALVGAICFAGAWAVNQPEGFDLAGSHFTQPLFMQIGSGAVSGAVWCGLWGLLGGWISRKISTADGRQRPFEATDVVQLRLSGPQTASNGQQSYEVAAPSSGRTDQQREEQGDRGS